MSVYYATTLQRIMGRLLQPAQVRAWIRGGDPHSRKADPQHFVPSGALPSSVDEELLHYCFTPSISSVITISAPQMLLSVSLLSLLLGIGVYLGFMWTRDLDIEFGRYDSRNIWIVYLVSTVVCVLVYSTSRLITDHENVQEDHILLQNCRNWQNRQSGAGSVQEPIEVAGVNNV